jgi:predicted type IV restriction endonuclease
MKINKKVSERIISQVQRFQKILKKAQSRDVNESDTVTIITDILASVFGFDKYTEITSEQAIRGTYCDLAVTLDEKIKYLIEVKAAGIDLKENHLRQAIGYGANHGISWVVLTNGITWEIYKIKFERPISHELVCSYDFTALNPRKIEDQEKIYLLCKEGIATDAIDEFHDHIQIVNRFMVGAVCLTEPVINIIRRELRKISSSVKVTNQEINDILLSEVIKRDVVEGEPFKDATRKFKRQQRKKTNNSNTNNHT